MYTEHGYCDCPCHPDDEEPMTEERWNQLKESAARFGRTMPSWSAHVAAQKWAARMESIMKQRMRNRE